MKIAQVDWDALSDIAGPNLGNTIGSIVTVAVTYIFPLAGFALLIYLVYGGYQIMFSEQVPQKIAKGWNTVLYAIIGFIIIFVAYWIVQFVGRALGIEAITNMFG